MCNQLYKSEGNNSWIELSLSEQIYWSANRPQKVTAVTSPSLFKQWLGNISNQSKEPHIVVSDWDCFFPPYISWIVQLASTQSIPLFIESCCILSEFNKLTFKFSLHYCWPSKLQFFCKTHLYFSGWYRDVKWTSKELRSCIQSFFYEFSVTTW